MTDNSKSEEKKVDNVDNTEKTVEEKHEDTSEKTVPLPTFLEVKGQVKKLNEELAKFQTEQQKQKEDKLKEDGKLQELINEKEAEIEKLKKDYEPDALAYREIVTQERKDAKEVLGDQFTEEELSDMSLTTLRKLVSVAKKKETPDTDNGGGNSPTQLTDSQKQEAQRMGLSEEAYKRFLEKRKSLKGE